MKVNVFLPVLPLVLLLAGCTSTPNVTVVDDLIDEETRGLVSESVWVLDHKNARSFEDPAWPAPIQIVSPSNKKTLTRSRYDVHLFGSAPSGAKIDVVYVRDGSRKNCNTLTTYLGITASDAAFIKINNDGWDELYRCGSVIFAINSSKNSITNPFINQYREIEFLSKEDKEKGMRLLDKAVDGRYPVFIRYIK